MHLTPLFCVRSTARDLWSPCPLSDSAGVEPLPKRNAMRREAIAERSVEQNRTNGNRLPGAAAQGERA